MKRLVAVTACPTGIAHTLMAAEALKRAAAAMGYEIRVETQGSLGTRDALTAAEIAAADVVLLATDIHVNETPFAGKPVHNVSTADAIRNSKAVIEAALALLPPEAVSCVAARPGRGGRSRRVVRRKEACRHHLLPDRHRPHFHGRGSVAESGQSPRAHDQGRNPGLGRREKSAHAGRHRCRRRGRDRGRHESRHLPFRRQAPLFHQHETRDAQRQGSDRDRAHPARRRHRHDARGIGRARQGRALQIAHRPLQASHDRRFLHAPGRDRGWSRDRARVCHRRHLRRRPKGNVRRGPQPDRRRDGVSSFRRGPLRLHRLFHRGPARHRARPGRRHARANVRRGFSRRHRFRFPRRLPDEISRRQNQAPAHARRA